MDEFMRITKMAPGMDKMDPSMFEMAFKMSDRNGDNYLDRKEMMAMNNMGKDGGRDGVTGGDPMAGVRMMDKDGDEMVSEEEYLKFVG